MGSLHTEGVGHEATWRDRGPLVATWQLHSFVKPFQSYLPSPNTHTQLRFFIRNWGDWKPEELKFPTSQAICSCCFCMPLPQQSLNPSLLPCMLRAPPSPGLTNADLLQEDFWRTSAPFLRPLPTPWSTLDDFIPYT